METATISATFQVVIPESIRERLNLRPGQQVHLIPYDNRIEFIPVRPIEEMRGFLRGMSTDFERDEDRA
ncbi:MAG: AbrB/MazE/SpoVT family DNA-binding domain-containing protein [Gemmatimonadetes bacterium]|nr:AbrB/MazE/SpoVT family DNA-binding domain-containing protein [Gemmatimonadota bacterium]